VIAEVEKLLHFRKKDIAIFRLTDFHRHDRLIEFACTCGTALHPSRNDGVPGIRMSAPRFR